MMKLHGSVNVNIALAMLIAALAGCQAQPRTHVEHVYGTPRWPRYDIDEVIIRRYEKLADRMTRIISVRFEQNKLVNVMDDLRNTTGVSILINWAALEAAGVEQDLLISLELNEVPAVQVLELVLKQAGAGALEPIGYKFSTTQEIDPPADENPQTGTLRTKGIVMVSTLRDLERGVETHVYPITDLLEWGSEPESPYRLAAEGGKPTIASMQQVDAKFTQMPVREERLEMIITLIQDTIGHATEWVAYGGEVSSLREFNGQLIVRAPYINHLQIQKLFNMLRQSRQASLETLMRHQEVLPLLKQAESQRMAQRYGEAMKLVNQALRVDPQHAFARAMKEVIEETIERRAK